jgi:hypothetical protein
MEWPPSSWVFLLPHPGGVRRTCEVQRTAVPFGSRVTLTWPWRQEIRTLTSRRYGAMIVAADERRFKGRIRLVLMPSGQRVVIIEAKAQQGYHVEPMEMLKRARELMKEMWPPARDTYLVALCSSRYTPGPKTRATFDAFCRWREMADFYPGGKAIYERADFLYGDRRPSKPHGSENEH